MSLKAMLWVMEEAPVKNQGELAVLYALADRAADDGSSAFPSQSWIAQRARCTTRTVRNHLQALEGRGVIERGDQNLVAHFSADRRPVVWDIRIDGGKNFPGGKIDRAESYDTTTGKLRHNDRKTVSYKPSLTIPEPSNQYLDQFAEFWEIYPRRVGKRTAQTAFTRACDRAPVEVILAGARQLAHDPNLPALKFVPHPTTWLNRNGWDDDPLPPRNQATEGPQAGEQPRPGTRASDWLQNASQARTGPDYATGHTIIEDQP